MVCADESELKIILGPHWWFHYGKALLDVIMPPDFYKIGPPDDRCLMRLVSELGLVIGRPGKLSRLQI